MRIVASASVLVLVAILVGPRGGSERTGAIELDGAGGDVWAFERQVSGRLPDAGCDEVVIESPRGAVLARMVDHSFSARVSLGEGPNQVVAICRRDDEQLRSAPQWWRVRIADRPRARAMASASGDRIVLDAAGSRPAELSRAPLRSFHWRPRAGNPAPLQLADGAGFSSSGQASLQLRAPAVDGDYYVDLVVTDRRGRRDLAATTFRVEDGQARTLDLDREHPLWADRAVVYGVVPFFFDPPNLDGVEARLDELDELGVDVLWLSPLARAEDGDFGYAVTDHFSLRPAFGDAGDLRELIAAAHRRGMRVIVDFVPNHTSSQHPYFAANGEFYQRDERGEPVHYFDWENLPNLDYDQPEVRRMVTEAFAYWVRELGVDGFRVDVAWGPRRRAPDFWPGLRRELKRIDPDLLLVAEAGARDPYYFEHGFDAAYDWTDELGKWAWRAAFEDPSRTAELLREALAVYGSDGPPGRGMVYRFLDNNDTGPRFVTRYGVPVARLGAALLLTLPGLPGIYTGGEIGAAYQPYDEGPPIAWRDRAGLEAWHRRLIALRRAEPALHGERMTLLDAGAPAVLAYRRHAPDAADDVLVLLNFSAKAAVAELPRAQSGDLVDLLGGEPRRAAGGRLTVSLEPHGAAVLRASR